MESTSDDRAAADEARTRNDQSTQVFGLKRTKLDPADDRAPDEVDRLWTSREREVTIEGLERTCPYLNH